jgi:hypothetical protein
MGTIRAWRLGVPLALWTLSGAAQTLPLRIQIMVYDRAGVAPKALSQAEGLTGKILVAAGVDTEWSAGAISDLQRLGTDFTARTPVDCASGSGTDLVRVAVFGHAPAGLPVQALGFSLPCAMTGIQVVIYADRVAKVSETNAPTFSRVLGYAMAHELGHVLLRSAGHGDFGLMRGVWSKSDWQRAAVSIIPFSPAQAGQITGMAQKARNTEMARLSPICKR